MNGPCRPHRDSHLDLLSTSSDGPRRVIDAVVVPHGRPAHFLGSAMVLAASLGCVLIALCSRDARAADVAPLAARVPGLRWLAVDVRPDYRHFLLTFDTDTALPADEFPLGLLNVKRNIGLLVGRMCGWQTILFLDDDVVGLDPATVADAATGLRDNAIVGLAVEAFPDNSAVCHANRLAGRAQATFVSGAAMLVDLRCRLGFFPRLYNEDWLFFFDALAQRRVARRGRVAQLPYDAFDDPATAVGEEFGEIIAEGLLDGLHDRRDPSTATDATYWAGFLSRRRAFVERATELLWDGPRSALRLAALRSLAAAERRRAEITPAACAEYVLAWRRDQADWQRRVSALPGQASIVDALAFLGLDRPLSKPVAPRTHELEWLHHARRADRAAPRPGRGFYRGPCSGVSRLRAQSAVRSP